MKLFHPVVQGRRANTCRHSRQILTCRLFDSCQKEGNFGSSQTSHICRHSFHFQMQRNMQALISLSDVILKEQTHHARVSLQSDFKLGLRVPAFGGGRPADGTTISFRCSLAPKSNLCQARWASQWAAGPGAGGPSLARPGPSVPAGGRVPGPAARSWGAPLSVCDRQCASVLLINLPVN